MATLQDRAKKPKILVLFQRKGSVERAVLEQFPGGEITTVDLEEKWKPTHCCDISDWVGMDRDTSGRSPGVWTSCGHHHPAPNIHGLSREARPFLEGNPEITGTGT